MAARIAAHIGAMVKYKLKDKDKEMSRARRAGCPTRMSEGLIMSLLKTSCFWI